MVASMPPHAFPRTLPEFIDAFPDDRAAFLYLVEARWPRGNFACPKCGGSSAWVHENRMLLQCSACRSQVSATAGTIMHRSHTKLRLWLLAAWMLVVDKRGTSAKQLERQLGVSYETAYMMLHKLRAGMVAPDRELLKGTVEVDESFLGGAKRGRDDALEKIPIIGAVEVRRNTPTTTKVIGSLTAKRRAMTTHPGRIRFCHLSSGRVKINTTGFVLDNVAEGATVVTDGLEWYEELTTAGYKHRVESTAHGTVQRDVLIHYHLVVANLKAWLAGTFHGAVGAKHVQAYLNEYCFRYNRRGNLYAAFLRVLQIGTSVRGPEYDELYRGEGEPGGWEHPNPPHAPAKRRRGASGEPG